METSLDSLLGGLALLILISGLFLLLSGMKNIGD